MSEIAIRDFLVIAPGDSFAISDPIAGGRVWGGLGVPVTSWQGVRTSEATHARFGLCGDDTRTQANTKCV